MTMLRIDPATLYRVARDADDLAERIHSTFGEDEVRASARSLESSDLDPFADRAAASVEKARQEFAKRILSHSEAIKRAGSAFEETNELHEVLFGEIIKRIEANRR